jgi:hypothetical protein
MALSGCWQCEQVKTGGGACVPGGLLRYRGAVLPEAHSTGSALAYTFAGVIRGAIAPLMFIN